MAILLRVCSFVFFIWFVMLPTHGSSEASDPGSELLIFINNIPDKHIQMMNLDTWEITTIVNTSNPLAVTYDSINAMIYWIEGGRNITRSYLDGSGQEVIYTADGECLISQADKVICEDGEYQCLNDACIPSSWLCDEGEDCENFGEDEFNCSIPCNGDEFQCNNTRCIEEDYVCDGGNDCGDGSDEYNCGEICSADETRCEPNNRCIYNGYVCDREDDCGNGFDELNCDYDECSPYREFTCGNLRCTPRRYLCDGGPPDCEDGTDEDPRYCSPNITGDICLVDIAIDEEGRRIFWLDAANSSINVANLDGSDARIISDTALTLPHNIHIDDDNGHVYWMSENRIQRTNLDGSERSEVNLFSDGDLYSFSSSIDHVHPFYPADITRFAVQGDRIQWIDSRHNSFESATLDGEVTLLYTNYQALNQLTKFYFFYHNTLFYTDFPSQYTLNFNFSPPKQTFIRSITESENPSYADGYVHVFAPTLGIKVRQTRSYHEGVIVVVDVPINFNLRKWRLDIHFPRQVFKLEVFGCDGIVQEKTTKEYGPRKASSWTIVSKSGGVVMKRGSKMRIKLDAKMYTIKGVRGFKRGMYADFYPGTTGDF